MAILSELELYSLDDLEAELGAKRFPDFVARSEASFKAQVNQVISELLRRESLEMVFISGPTSSGKTTFTNHLVRSLTQQGRTACLLSIDDYYFEQPTEYDAWGRPDMESVDTIDMAYLRQDLSILAQGGEIVMPVFDFKERRRHILPERTCRLEPGEVLLVEGLHALSDEVIGKLDPETYLTVFIMPYAQFIEDKRSLSPEDLRKLRRISRDVNYRRATALSTLDYWPAIAKEEAATITAYLGRADFYINSFLPYELVVIAPAANRAIQDSLALYEQGTLPPSDNVRPGVYYADLEAAVTDAKRLSQVAELLPSVDSSVIPEDSILQEFI